MDQQSQSQQNTTIRDDKFIYPIKHQRFCVISVLTPNCFCEELANVNKDTYAIMVRGIFEKPEDSVSRANTLNAKKQPLITFSSEVGKWVPFDVSFDYNREKTMSNDELRVLYEHRNNELNLFMRDYHIALHNDSMRQQEEKNKKLENANVVTDKYNIDPSRGEIGKVKDLEDKGKDIDVSKPRYETHNFEQDYPFDKDYLDEDRPLKELVKHQNYYVVSLLTPGSFPESERNLVKNRTIWGIKIRGVYETDVAIRERMKHLQTIDKYHNMLCCEIGELVPLNVDISCLETQDGIVYREDRMNECLDAYKNTVEPSTENVDNNFNTSETLNKLRVEQCDETETETDNVTDNDTIVETKTNTTFSNLTSVNERIANATRERDELQQQVNRNSVELEEFRKKLEDLNAMFNSLNK